MSDLNNCRCGGKAEIRKCADPHFVHIGCTKCPSQIGSAERGWTKEESAIAWWNTAHPKTTALPEPSQPASV